MTILVVEDNPDNMDLVSWILEDEGYSFVGVSSGEECLQIIEQQDFELVLMDISLPGITGTEVTRRLRADPRFSKLPILACTAHAIKSEAEEILASGVDDILVKPIDEQILLHQVKQYLQSRD